MNNKQKNVFFERGSWYYRSKRLGSDFTVKYFKKGGFKTESEAALARDNADAEFDAKLRGAGSTSANVTFIEYLLSFLYCYYSKSVESTTVMVYDYVLNKLVIPHANDIGLRLVSTEYINALLQAVDSYGKSTANKTREFLHLAFENAVGIQIIKSNPVTTAQKYARNSKKIKILSKSQLQTFLSVAYADPTYPEILFALFLGLRKGEILGLKFSDFNISKKEVFIQRQAVMSYSFNRQRRTQTGMVLRDPKTKSSFRVIPVPKVLLEETVRLKKKRESMKSVGSDQFNDQDIVFCQKNGNLHFPSYLNISINRICTKAALPAITPHTLRHMYGTILLEQGETLETVSALMGHDSVHTTFEVYADVMCSYNAPAAAINNAFSEMNILREGGISNGNC